MAAFERVSNLYFKRQGREDTIIDIRKALLPDEAPDYSYNPLHHRNPKNPIKPWMAYTNLLRTLIGPGILMIPLAISQAGMIIGPAMTVLTGLLVMHTHLMLLNSLTEISRQLEIPYISYRYGFRIALLHGPPIFHTMGNHGPALIATFMFLSQLGICTVFVVLCADSLRDLMDWESNEPALLALLVPFMILEYCMKSLHIVSYIASIGAIVNIVSLSMIFYLIFSHQEVGQDVQTESSAMFILYGFGAMLFNLSAVGVIIALDKNVKNAKIMTKPFGVVPVGIFIPTLVSVTFGTLAYWSFGTVDENVLRSLPLDDNVSVSIISLYLVSVAFVYPIQCHPAIAVIIEVLKYNDPMNVPDPSTLRIVRLISRPVFVLLTFLISYLVQFQGPFVAFVGNLCTNILSLIFPALMDTCLRYPNNYGRVASERLVKSDGSLTILNISQLKLPTYRPEDVDYDPREHRTPAQPIKPWMAYFNILRTMFGAGMLGMPSAVSQAGIILGPTLALLTGGLLIHTQTLLLESLTEISRQLRIPHITYRFGFRLALLHGPPFCHGIGRQGPKIIGTFMFLNQLGICTVFVSLTSDSLRDIMDWQSNRPALLTLLFPYLLLEFFMKTLKIVSYVSLMGNFLNLVGLFLIAVQCFSNLTGDLVSINTSSMGIMVAFGIFLFNMSAVAVLLAVDKALKEAKLMTTKFGIINVGIFVPCVVGTLFGVIGYCSFGTMEENILRSLPLDEMSSIAAISMSLLAVTFAYPIQCYPGVAIVMEVIKYHNPSDVPSPGSLLLIESIARPIFVVISFILCYLVPFQTPLVAFVGNMCTSMLSLVFPALMDLCLRAAFERISRLNYKRGSIVIDVARTRLPSVRPDDSDYDPRDYRTPAHPIKPWMAYFNLLRTMCGAGMLGMPIAISQGGILLGPFLAIFSGLLLIHTHTMLLDTLTEVSRQLKLPHVSYRYGFRLAVLHGPPICHSIGNSGPAIIATFMFLSQLGICTVFVSLTSDSLRDIMDWQSNRPALLTLLFPYLLLEFFMKSLKIVSYVALLGNGLNLVGLILIIIQLLSNLTGDLVTVKTTTMGTMVAFGICMFNLSAVGVILTIDKALKEAKLMTSRFGIINVGIFVPCVISTIFGILGYCSFGTIEENILRSLPIDEFSSMASIALYLIAVAFAYPVQCYPAIAVILEVIKYHDPLASPSAQSLLLIESIARPIFVLMSFILCYLVPFQTPLVAFVGNMCTSMLSLVFPALMDLCLRYPNNYGAFNLRLFKDMIIIVAGICALTFGVLQCGYLIYIRILTLNSPTENGFY